MSRVLSTKVQPEKQRIAKISEKLELGTPCNERSNQPSELAEH